MPSTHRDAPLATVVNVSIQADSVGPLTFDCPRCETSVTQEFYGPCLTCHRQLRELYASESVAFVADDYVPKMNVTPNAVALKDD